MSDGPNKNLPRRFSVAHMRWTDKRLSKLFANQFSSLVLASELLFIVLFGVLADYDVDASPNRPQDDGRPNHLTTHYPMFQDIHVMVFVGFGFLYTFLHKYAYSSVGFSLLLAAYAIQWSVLFEGFFNIDILTNTFSVDIRYLINAEFCAASILVAMGAYLGTLSPVQYVLSVFFQVFFYTVNRYIYITVLKADDAGGSSVIHAFGAYFGLSLSRMVANDAAVNNPKEASSYFDDLFSILGTIFLWMFWPSFNAGLCPTVAQSHRAVINTYLALAACCLVAFALSAALNPRNRLHMMHIQNATLAGGVAVGAASTTLMTPCGALIIGTVAGLLSVVGFEFLTPFLKTRLRTHDTCGVHNLHGMPGILGGLVTIIMAWIAQKERYGDDLLSIYPARTYRSSAVQAGFQAVGLVITLAIAVLGGTITGAILKLKFWRQLESEEFFDDTNFWELPEDLEGNGDAHPIEADSVSLTPATTPPQYRKNRGFNGTLTEERKTSDGSLKERKKSEEKQNGSPPEAHLAAVVE